MDELLATALIVFATASYAPPHEETASDLTRLSLPQLGARLDREVGRSYFLDQRLRSDHFEAILQEVARRGGTQSEALLAQRLTRRPAELAVAKKELENRDRGKDLDAWVEQSCRVRDLEDNAELLTALRRVQNKPDPFRIEVLLAVDVPEWPLFGSASDLLEVVEKPSRDPSKRVEAQLSRTSRVLEDATRRLRTISEEKEALDWRRQKSVVDLLEQRESALRWEAMTMPDMERLAAHAVKVDRRKPVRASVGKLPIFVVSRQSADVERVAVWSSQGGDRSGRQSRWRFEVKDSTGKPARAREWRIGIGGGISLVGLWQHGHACKEVLPMSSYVEDLKPGDYTVTILYHNTLSIADLADPRDLEDLIVFRSPPFLLTVE